jgi:hypothetical protein
LVAVVKRKAKKIELSIMLKKHAQLKEYGIGPSKGSTASSAQLNEV